MHELSPDTTLRQAADEAGPVEQGIMREISILMWGLPDNQEELSS